jgi:hypothetical protein
VRARLQRLHAKISAECSGEHRYVKHRDLNPPWCDACGYTDTGLHGSEVHLGQAREGRHRNASRFYSDEFLAEVAEVYLEAVAQRSGRALQIVEEHFQGKLAPRGQAWVAAA